jgi:hypothetical protein
LHAHLIRGTIHELAFVATTNTFVLRAQIVTRACLTITKLLPNILSAESLTHVPITHREEMARPLLIAFGSLLELSLKG